MPAKFFDASEGSQDLLLLPPASRTEDDLEALADAAEAEVLAAYTGTGQRVYAGVGDNVTLADLYPGAYVLDDSTDPALFVFLRGYNPDPLECEANLAAALKREIAHFIPYLAAKWRTNPLTAAESAGDGGKSVTFREDKNNPRPPGFGRYLRPFQVMPPAVFL